jgi:uncharacterized membrane protein YqjE
MSEPILIERSRVGSNGHDRSLGSIISEIKEELKEFVNTRVEMVKAELRETVGAAKVAVPLGIMALALGWVAFLMFTLAVVVLIHSAFAGSTYAWFYAFVIVGFLWACFGAVAAFFAYNAIRSHGRFPKRTAEVLKADKMWLQTEARSHS